MFGKDDRNQDRFLGNIRKALGLAPDKRRSAPPHLFAAAQPPETAELLAAIASRSSRELMKLLAVLQESAKVINLQVTAVADPAAAAAAIADLVQAKQPEWGTRKSLVSWRHPLIDALQLPDVLAAQNVPVIRAELPDQAAVSGDAEPGREAIRQTVTDSYIGVTSADFCLAETATLVMKSRPGQARSVSLVPSIHVAVIRLEQLLTNLKELYALLRWSPEQREEGLTNCMTFISGPSKTADIELTMVHGAHGPRELHLYVVTEPL